MKEAAGKEKREEMKEEDEENEEETLEELEGFDDFTLASSWERFISEIEAVCRQWLADGPKNLLKKGADCLGSPNNLYKVKSELKYGMKSYCMEYFFEISGSGKVVEWSIDLHNLQLSFGVKEFLLIAPISASGVVLDAPEASKLLSAVAIALSNSGSIWPAFVPVHDPSREAYIGIQNMGTDYTRRFEADRIGSQVPIKLMHLEGLYELFISKFKLQSKQRAKQDTTLARLEKSRLYLLKRITEHPGRTLDVIQDMLAFLRNEINTINRNLTNPMTEKADHTKQQSTIHTTKMTNGIISSLNSCFKVLSYPLNLPKATGKIARFAITAVTVVSVIHFHQMNHQHIIKGDKLINQIDAYYGKKDNLQLNSTQAGEMGFFQCISKTSLDVSNGRG